MTAIGTLAGWGSGTPKQPQLSWTKRGALSGGNFFRNTFFHLTNGPASTADRNILAVIFNEGQKEKVEIKSLKRGECLMFLGDEHILHRIDSAEYEREKIENNN